MMRWVGCWCRPQPEPRGHDLQLRTGGRIESDWPDTLRVNRYVTGRAHEPGATSALGDFRRFPSWMWRNAVMVEFIEWLRDWNHQHPQDPTGIFGMDLYSLHASIDAVLDYLDRVDPQAADRARDRYSCFEHFGDDPQLYGFAATQGDAEPCEGAPWRSSAPVTCWARRVPG